MRQLYCDVTDEFNCLGGFFVFHIETEAIKMSLDLEYFYGNEAEQYSFYRIPKTLFTDQRYRSVSMEAKVLYDLMLDRMGCPSAAAGWMGTEGCISTSRWRLLSPCWAAARIKLSGCSRILILAAGLD